ncbi:pupal cuticle protein Edg-91-like [Palaemon carinicauda]|uniref:pupal cuticle protein Edg-91-like n=1 Tax=Palaemon carinicauda TaxID=392227 RepID=UPI0035B58789
MDRDKLETKRMEDEFIIELIKLQGVWLFRILTDSWSMTSFLEFWVWLRDNACAVLLYIKIAILLVAFVAEGAPVIGYGGLGGLGGLGLGGLGFNGGFGGGYGGYGGLLSAGNYANGYSHSNGYNHGNHIGAGYGGLGGLSNGHLNTHFLGKRSADPEPVLPLGGLGYGGLGLGGLGLGLNGGYGGGYGGYGGLLSAGNYANGYSHSDGYSHGNHIGNQYEGLGGLSHGHTNLLGK